MSINDGKTIVEEKLGEKKLRIVCVSDTHGVHGELSIPQADVFIHGIQAIIFQFTKRATSQNQETWI